MSEQKNIQPSTEKLTPNGVAEVTLPQESEYPFPLEVCGPHDLAPNPNKLFSLIDKKAERVYFERVKEWDKRAKILHASPEQTPTCVNEGLGLHFATITLYHGGDTPDITNFLPAEETTIGEGLYTTSMPDQAFGYAVKRADSRKKVGDTITVTGSNPVVYEVEVTDVTFLDLRSPENRQRVMTEYAQYLEEWLETQKQRKDLTWQNERYLGVVDKKIDYIHEHKGNLPQRAGLKEVLWHTGSIFTEFVIGLGYDEVIGLEGGEGGYTGSHDSWVIMDPSRARVTNELTFLTPEVSDDDARQAHIAKTHKYWSDTPLV